MKLVKVGVAALLLSSSVALADGAKRDSAFYDYGTWSGVYFGVHAGGGWSDVDWRFANANFYGPAGTRFSTEADGALFGGHVGLNHQWGSLVAGIEVSFSGTNIRGDAVGFVPVFPRDRFTGSIEDLLTVTGRIGYATSNLLLYARGGYANADVELSANSGVPVANVAFSTSERTHGWTVGGGIEYKLHPKLVLGVEYNYVRLDGERFSATAQPGGGPVRVDMDDLDLHTVTARLSILLGRDDRREPLK